MSFLSRLVGRELGKMVGGAIVDAISNNSSSNDSTQNNYSQGEQSNYNYNETTSSFSNGNSLSGYNIEQNFYDFLTSEFPEYEIRRNVPASEFNANQYALDYSFGMYKENKPQLMIMLTPHNKYKNRPYTGAQVACQVRSIPFMFFFTHFDNDKDYVRKRILKCLNNR